MQRIHPISVHAALRLMVVTIVALLVGGIGSWPLPAGAYTSLPPAPPATGAAPALQLNRTLAPGKLTTAFAQAGAEFNVPPTVLAAIGYVESHWENRAGQPNDYQQYGIMGLRTPPGGDSLARAATLLGQAPATLQTDPTSNIRGAAALLHQLALADDKALPGTLAAWYPIVARYSAIPDPRVARSYAYSVFTILRDGVSGTTRSGETIRVPAAGALDLPDSADPLLATPASDDYGPAHWVAANANNFQLGRDYGPLNFIIIHDTEGSYQSAISWFQNASSGVSAHYVIRSSDGDITQMVHNADTAYHAGNWDYNVRAIGVEHEGYMNQQGWYTPALYAASAALVRTMADRFSIHKDHAHIIGHYQVPNQIQPPHVDPGPNWDWAGYLALVRNDAAVVARVRNIDGGFDASPGIIDAAHGWSIYNGGWNGGQAYRALSTTGAATNMATWTATLPAAGLYDVYAYIPWVDNGRAETSSARYTLNTPGGAVTVTLDQKALTDAGVLQGNLAPEGEWAHLGRFNLSTSSAVALSNATGDSALNVWFDTLMWIPAGAVPSPTPPPTNTALPTHTPTRVPTATPSSTATPVPTDPPTATWTPGPCGMSFSDLPDTNWAYPYVSYLYCSGIISGYGDGTFRGGAGANRGQLTKMLALGMGWAIPTPEVPSFVDVPLTSPYFYYVEDAYAHGAVSGYADGTFRPYAGITRAQLSKMIVSAKGWPLQTPDPPSFVDVPPTYWAFSFIETAHAQGIVGGYADGTFRPGNPTTRAQLAKMLSTALQSPNPTTPTATVAPSPSATDTTGPATSTSTSTSTPVTTTVTVTATSTP